MLSLPHETWIGFIAWWGIGLSIYFLCGAWHTCLRQGVDVGETENIFPSIEP